MPHYVGVRISITNVAGHKTNKFSGADFTEVGVAWIDDYPQENTWQMYYNFFFHLQCQY